MELPVDRWAGAVEERAKHVPLQYILGSQPFGELNIKCRPGVLIPRNETEEWCERLKEVVEKIPDKVSVVDYCTGTGCVALSMATLSNVEKITAFDIDESALRLARENLKLNKDLLQTPVSFEKGNLLQEKHPKLAATLLLSNPPYIPEKDFNLQGGVEQSVLLYEPRSALVGDLEFYTALAELLRTGSFKAFVFEIGYREQALHTKKLLPAWTCGIRTDSHGNVRNVVGWQQEWNALRSMCDELL
ncbi:hypothetical protein OGAPHI_004574 [Ogataea philodendri]|uniref:peptide chain release factor N(5)-glutamine methyltransferase n=1 Tax=Ogataea philodendri TaxID=1378263 RepID=A0A9P8P1S6_9ASCO|nr:uncharacterized protein OGAPHI_004574 [Ogataea philodendri]KAH3664223.1 hypothetical protein OGAPHI_004574 [Ogataea philodendri]